MAVEEHPRLPESPRQLSLTHSQALHGPCGRPSREHAWRGRPARPVCTEGAARATHSHKPTNPGSSSATSQRTYRVGTPAPHSPLSTAGAIPEHRARRVPSTARCSPTKSISRLYSCKMQSSLFRLPQCLGSPVTPDSPPPTCSPILTVIPTGTVSPGWCPGVWTRTCPTARSPISCSLLVPEQWGRCGTTQARETSPPQR